MLDVPVPLRCEACCAPPAPSRSPVVPECRPPDLLHEKRGRLLPHFSQRLAGNLTPRSAAFSLLPAAKEPGGLLAYPATAVWRRKEGHRTRRQHPRIRRSTARTVPGVRCNRIVPCRSSARFYVPAAALL